MILSGAGSDGAAGVEAIKTAGAVTFTQDAATAKFAAMPQAAVAIGCVDFVLASRQELRGTDIAPAADEERFGDILAILHEATGIDFSLYREKTIKRRIPRRLALRNIDNLVEYAKRRHDSE